MDSRLHKKTIRYTARKRRSRARISGTATCPRVSVFRSLRSLSLQAIDDEAGKTLAAVSLSEVKGAKNTAEGAMALGLLMAEKCKKIGIQKAVFDRSGHTYHGKVKALADGLREGGMTV